MEHKNRRGHMVFQIDQQAEPSIVALKVENLENMVKYYKEKIGLSVIKRSDKEASLGIKSTQTILIILKEIPKINKKRRTAGLYHTAFLLPTREDLGNVLYSLIIKKVPIIGASDHGYSEAVYLEDPEGNGIEIYRDKPREEWDVKEDGRIAGITIEMDAEGVLQAKSDQPSDRFPEGTKIGHVHLSVSDLKQTEKFYSEILGLDIKERYGEQALFFAADGYHHHIGSNIWLGKNLNVPEAKDRGLDYFTLTLSSTEEVGKVEQQLSSYEVPFTKENKSLVVKDPNGIQIKIDSRR